MKSAYQSTNWITPAFMDRRIRTRLISGGMNPACILLDDLAVLVVGLRPDMDQFVEAVVDAFDRVPVDQPLGGDGRLGGADRQDAERDGVVRQHVVPRRRVMVEQQRADTVHVDVIGKPHLHGLAAGDRIADRLAQKGGREWRGTALSRRW